MMKKFKESYEKYNECLTFSKNNNPILVKDIKTNIKIDFYLVISNIILAFICLMLSIFTFHSLYWLILIHLSIVLFFGKKFFTEQGKKDFRLYRHHSYKDLVAIYEQFYTDPQLVKEVFNSMVEANYSEEILKKFTKEIEDKSLTYHTIQLAYKSLPDHQIPEPKNNLYHQLMQEHQDKDDIKFFEKNK